ncbi:MAG: sigma-54-dependent Fis family transcriptional regulator [Polyangiaceae bacterium]|nr:sigma-54-dependent Fis family transcriptional regulator [Polyangiaceae bacterium]
MAKVLVVEDEPGIRYMLSELFADAGHDVVVAADGQEALEALDGVDLVLTDLTMPRLDGMALLEKLSTLVPDMPVIVLTAQGSEKAAVEAMRRGAFDYQSKPCEADELLLAISRVLRHGELTRRKDHADAERRLAQPVLGSSAAFSQLLTLTRRVADRDITVQVTGETGTGKELIASLLHTHSRRRNGPLIRFNCAPITESLAESELFGHEKGAFTGAVARRQGYFQQADGGTLVLDEIGELPSELQPKLLRALQSGEVQPVGASRPSQVDVRVVACTHRDLAKEVQVGRFREDLMYRLNVVTLHVPPLRDRPEDIAALAESFRRRFAAQFGLEDVPFDPALMAKLERYAWPGNVRELENSIAGWLATSVDGKLGVDDVKLGSSANAPRTPAGDGAGTLRQQVSAYERSLLKQAVEASGNHSQAARVLGVTRTTLLDKLRRYNSR